MSFRLRSFDATPPGGYPYEQTEGIRRKFCSEPMVEAQARIVSNFRKGNGLPRASIIEAMEDISEYTCRRLGGNSAFCVDSDTPVLALNQSSPIISPCAGCGAPIA